MRIGPNRRALTQWLEQHRPDVLDQMEMRSMGACRQILNRETGLQIEAWDDIEATCPLYLEAFKAKQGAAS